MKKQSSWIRKLSRSLVVSIVILGTIGTAYAAVTLFRHGNVVSSDVPVVDNHSAMSPASVWNQETEPNYAGVKEMTVYRSPNCGCCGGWIEHAKQHGFQVTDIKTDDIETIKQQYNLPSQLASCHTTIVDGYVMEGHIPVDDIKRFLTQKPNFAGLAVPGMPVGTPGMEAGDMKQPFEVVAFNNSGEVEVFKEYQSY